MPSDLSAAPVETGPASASRWDWLSSQGLGVLCGQTTVLLLAIGSVVLSSTRDGASAMIGMDDIRGFFAPASIVHLWFYLLLLVMGLYGLNTLLATWKSVMQKWRSGVRRVQAYAAAVVHLGFLLGLFAHLVGGLGSGELGQVSLGPDWTALGDGREARLVALDVPRLPDGGIKQVEASVELRDGTGAHSTATVSYNGPLSSGLGSDLLLLIRPGSVVLAKLRLGDDRCALASEAVCSLGAAEAKLLFLQPPRGSGAAAMARVRIRAQPGVPTSEFWLKEGVPTRLPDGSRMILEGIEARPAIHLRHRHAPGNPWALFSTFALATGLALMWRRFS
jgi:hypothetical protein